VSTPKIVYEDEALMVIDKPSGWIVNDAITAKDKPTVQGWLRRNFDFPVFKFQILRNGIVHRLDKETSGLLLIAKTKEAFEQLQSQFKSRKVEKSYIALTHGRVEPKEGEIITTVGRLPWRRDRFGIVPGGRESESKYKVISYHSKGKEAFSLVEFYPKTGRTHQIRIHAKFIGHPIVGDSFYAGRKTARKDRLWCPRLFLHAKSVSFTDPITDRKVSYKSALPGELKKSLEVLTPVA